MNKQKTRVRCEARPCDNEAVIELELKDKLGAPHIDPRIFTVNACLSCFEKECELQSQNDNSYEIISHSPL